MCNGQHLCLKSTETKLIGRHYLAEVIVVFIPLKTLNGSVQGGIGQHFLPINSSCNDDKIYQYERFADFVEDNIEIYENDEYCETEEDLMENFNEVEAETDAQWDSMFPDGRDDD